MSVKGRVLFLSILSSLMRIIISAVIVGMGNEFCGRYFSDLDLLLKLTY
jgi:hypothetical protein